MITTSTPIDQLDDTIIERGYARLAELGLELVEAPNCRRRVGHSAGSIAARVEVLHSFVADTSIDGIIAFWGGHQTHQLLEYIDLELFKAHPKPIIGYSDLTPLLNYITSRTGLVTYSGPAVISFAKPTLFDYTRDEFKRALFEGGSQLEYAPADTISTNLWYEQADLAMVERPATGWKTYRPGRARGRLFGGNLGSLLWLSATPYWPDLRGAILFAEEDEDESSETIDNFFTKLRHMGVYEQINGLVIGRFPDSVGLRQGDDLPMILDDALAGHQLPVLYDLDFGHTDPIFTLPLGAMAEVDATQRRFRVIEPWCI